MTVDHANTCPASTGVHGSRSDSTMVSARIQGPSEHGTDYWTIVYERSGVVVPHDCAPVARMSLLRVACVNVPSPPHLLMTTWHTGGLFPGLPHSCLG